MKLKCNRLSSSCLILLFIVCYGNNAVAEPGCSTKGLNIEANDVVVLFTAKWSGPDKKLIPVLDSVAKSFPEIPLHKIDVDESPELAKSCEIRGVPTVITFVAGQKLKAQIGVVPKAEVEQFFKSVSANK